MVELKFTDKIEFTKEGEPAINLVVLEKDEVIRSVWLSPFKTFFFQITGEPGKYPYYQCSIQTDLCKAINFKNTPKKRKQTLEYFDDEFTGKTHLAGLISISLITFANTLFNDDHYKLPNIKYACGEITQEQEGVLFICKFIDMVYDYLKK